MNNKKILTIISMACLFAIPQLLFFWLAPKSKCYIAVYIIGTVLIFSHLIITYILSRKRELRIIAGVVVAGAAICMFHMIVSAILLAAHASLRTAIFSLMVVVLIYIVIISILLCVMNDNIVSQAGSSTHSRNQRPLPNWR